MGRRSLSLTGNVIDVVALVIWSNCPPGEKHGSWQHMTHSKPVPSCFDSDSDDAAY